LNVALAIEGTLGDFDQQFLQVARALDPARARAPPDTDTNDLSTINVYTVGILLRLHIPILTYCVSAFLLNQSRRVRNGPSSYKDLLDALGMIALIVVLCDQVDQWKDRLSFRRTTPSDLPPQRDTSEPSHFYRHTCEARDI
jgi:hypothetical protein